MQAGIDLLVNDSFTEVIVIIAKPPAPAVQQILMEKINACPKPVVVHFQGAKPDAVQGNQIKFADTLADTAALAVEICGGHAGLFKEIQAHGLAFAYAPGKELNREQRTIRGVFGGGTFCGEAAGIIQGELGAVYTNARVPGVLPLSAPGCELGHACIDMGEDEFTKGKPHPMLEPIICRERILLEASRPQAAVLLIDVVLGYGAHADPAGVLSPILQKARDEAAAEDRGLAVIAHVCGTDKDPQVRENQVKKLGRSGVIVPNSNAEAARLACRIAKGRGSMTA
jgi:hypothetical protein